MPVRHDVYTYPSHAVLGQFFPHLFFLYYLSYDAASISTGQKQRNFLLKGRRVDPCPSRLPFSNSSRLAHRLILENTYAHACMNLFAHTCMHSKNGRMRALCYSTACTHILLSASDLKVAWILRHTNFLQMQHLKCNELTQYSFKLNFCRTT